MTIKIKIIFYIDSLLIGASTGRTDVSSEEYSRVHIQSNHAFSILAAHALSRLFLSFCSCS